ARGPRAITLTTVIISVGALSALYGIIQYSFLKYDTLDHRAHGAFGHYMTYSGVLMLVTCAAGSHLLFGKTRRQTGQTAGSSVAARVWTGDRQWTALVLPTLIIALGLTLTRSAWLGMSVAFIVLLSLANRKLLVALPLLFTLLLLVMPHQV